VFDKVLIANRGEIALRIVRACRELGVASVVVHSTVDRASAPVALADESVEIGPDPPHRSYLNGAAILEAALQTGAEALHPGYGFLSESADFAEACASLGLVLIGPPADVLAQLGDKTAARSIMAGVGLPLLPGNVEPLSADDAFDLARAIGFPVIVKAAAGGGGRGLRVVREPDRFLEEFRSTRAAAQTLFGDPTVYVESYLEAARHVEVQVLADTHGRVVDLGDRDCTVQRRHQKLVEESPAPGLAADLTARIRASAVAGAKAVGYVGAGTFEFLVSPDGDFHFMEVNPRIQVEHPVTEMVTGIDLVQQQIRVAAGEPLPDGLGLAGPGSGLGPVTGAAIECRVNAEDPALDFAPTPGLVDELVLPGGPFVRVDTHLRQGDRIPPNYDSLVAKVIVWAPDRHQAIARIQRALGETRVAGPHLRNTIPFLQEVLADPRFRGAHHDTRLAAQLAEGALEIDGG